MSSSSAAADEKLSVLLGSPDFCVSEYLDVALSANDEMLQRRMAELALQLQLQTQACHEDIGRIGAELQAILPRCAADLGRVGVGLEGLRLDATAIQQDMEKLLPNQSNSGAGSNSGNTNNSATGNDGENKGANTTTASSSISSSLETLGTLHALRSNLTQTKEILQAAATWDTTLQSLTPLLMADQQQQHAASSSSSSHNLTQAVAALSQLENGERALRGMPNGREERLEALANIRERVQVMLQPQLQHALQSMASQRLAPLQQCVELYQSLDQLHVLQAEYVKQRPSYVHKAWFAYRGTGAADALLAWLPGWYDHVLGLLTEERRQALAVFGPDQAPQMIAQVLAECFRPILGSFKTRLEQLFSPETATSMTMSAANATATATGGAVATTTSADGSLESICALYEATLQFLSLAYETVAGGWHDVADITTTQGSVVYKTLTDIFAHIASPFQPYQLMLSKLESHHSGLSQQLIQKDIQAAVGVVVTTSSSSVAVLQDATEKLIHLAPFVFNTLAESALARLELLTGGYQIRKNLSSIDSLLANHAGELAIAIRTLSTNNRSSLEESFDDQHVSTALEILKVVGLYQAGLRAFETKTRERLAVLQQRMMSHSLQEKEIFEKASQFLLPDALSVVEIDSILTNKALESGGSGSGGDDHDSHETLHRLASADSILYGESMDALGALKRSCHALVFDVCSAVPRKQLAGLTSMPSWSSSSDTGADSYGTLAQPYITQVGEHILALVQALEPFATNKESLKIANTVMSGIRKVAVQPWKDFISAIGISNDTIIERLMQGKELIPHVNSGFEEEEQEDDDAENEDEGLDPDEKAANDFCNQWLDVVGMAVTGRLLERVMRIPRLSAKGCDHLSADFGYLVNVLAALGLPNHPHPLVNHIAELARLDQASFQMQLQQRDKSIPIVAAVCSMEERLAAMRGVS